MSYRNTPRGRRVAQPKTFISADTGVSFIYIRYKLMWKTITYLL